jgi:tetratricopeptide (TPR) repeat protein
MSELPEIFSGRYRPLRPLGRGAMGEVWLVADTHAGGRELALKTIPPGEKNAKLGLALKREFRVTVALSHPHCIEARDYGALEDGRPFFTTALVPGRSLDELAPMAAVEVRRVLVDLLLALGYIHRLGWVHRDVKPANVRVGPNGHVTLMDFGLAARAGLEGAPISGTLEYLAPDAIRGAPLDRRADLYSLGALAYHMLTGRPPFEAATPAALIAAHLGTSPTAPMPAMGGADPVLGEIVVRLLAKAPEARYPSAERVLTALGFAAPPGVGADLLVPALVERETELAFADAALAGIAGGGPGVATVFVGGSGSGKSRLADELHARAQLAELPCGRGRFAAHGQAPYTAIAACLRALLPAFRRHVPEALEAASPILATLLPELAASNATSTAAPNGVPTVETGAEARRLVSDTVVGLLDALAGATGFVLLIEDLHLADPATSALVAELAVRAARTPLVLFATARFDEEAEAGPISAAPGQPPSVTPLAPAVLASRIAARLLVPLSPSAVQRMAAAMLGTETIGTPLVDQLVTASEGVPARVVQLLEHLTRTHALPLGPDGWLTDQAVPPEALPHAERDRLTSLLKSMSAETRRIASSLAVLDGAMPETLAAVAEVTDDELLDALDALEQARLVKRDARDASMLVTGEVGAAALAMLESSAIARLHERAAAALRSEYGDPAPEALPHDVLVAVAGHLVAARQAANDATPLDAEAVAHALAAGIRCAALFDLDDALAFFNAGLAISERMPEDARAGLARELLWRTGLARMQAGRFDEAVGPMRTAISLADAVMLRQEAAKMRTGLVTTLVAAERFEEAAKEGATALRACLAANMMPEAAACMQAAAQARLFLGEASEAVGLTRGALTISENNGLPCGQALVALGRTLVVSDPAAWPEGLARLEDGIGLLEREGNMPALAEAHGALADALAAVGEHSDAWRSARAQLRTALKIGQPAAYVGALIRLAAASTERAEPLEARRLARDAEAGAEQHRIRGLRAFARLETARALAASGDPMAAVATLHDVVEDPDRVLAARQRLARAEVWLMLGELGLATEAAESLADLAAVTGLAGGRWRWLAVTVELDIRLGRLDAAAARLRELVTGAADTDSVGLLAVAAHLEALLAMAREQWADAQSHIERARLRARSAGQVGRLAELEGLRGEVALALGEDAWPAYEAMREAALRSGCTLTLARAELGLAASRPYAATAPALAQAASARLLALADGLQEADRAWFLAPVERMRVIQGNYIGYSLPRVVRRGTGRPFGPNIRPSV